MLAKLVPVLLLVFLSGCSESPQATEKNNLSGKNNPEVTSARHAAEDYSLVFFLDPNGGPCRMQDAILRGMAEELRGVVDLRYVQTTVPADLEHFYAFGVRGLPTLLIADAAGKEIRRLPPGVKSAEEIRGLLQTISGR